MSFFVQRARQLGRTAACLPSADDENSEVQRFGRKTWLVPNQAPAPKVFSKKRAAKRKAEKAARKASRRANR